MELEELKDAVNARESDIRNIRSGMAIEQSKEEKTYCGLVITRLRLDVELMKQHLEKARSSGTLTPFTPTERSPQEEELECTMMDNYTSHTGWKTLYECLHITFDGWGRLHVEEKPQPRITHTREELEEMAQEDKRLEHEYDLQFWQGMVQEFTQRLQDQSLDGGASATHRGIWGTLGQ